MDGASGIAVGRRLAGEPVSVPRQLPSPPNVVEWGGGGREGGEVLERVEKKRKTCALWSMVTKHWKAFSFLV
jgi:hypothetical protein